MRFKLTSAGIRFPKDASCGKYSDKEGQCTTKYLVHLPVWTMTILHTTTAAIQGSHPNSVILVNPSVIEPQSINCKRPQCKCYC